eukprot:3723059-Pleurochrysis_carterae.AAC.5
MLRTESARTCIERATTSSNAIRHLSGDTLESSPSGPAEAAAATEAAGTAPFMRASVGAERSSAKL